MRSSPLHTALLFLGHILSHSASAGPPDFVTRSGNRLIVEGRPFYFVGTNAYYLLEEAARGDTQTVTSLFETSRNLGITVVRTWGFNDSPDSLNPSVIQYRPGMFKEDALRALDFVLWQARQYGIRIILALVNNWDDYGGMNQYVRWYAAGQLVSFPLEAAKFSDADLTRIVAGQAGRQYKYAVSHQFGHDDFYSSEVIKGWYKAYLAMLLRRFNTFTGVQYRDDPTLFGWELANEPRSSDRSAMLITGWASEMSIYIKGLDQNHLVGTGEEGFDRTTSGYTTGAYSGQSWLFDGTAGASFTANTSLESIDFASIHLYPESWNVTSGAGNVWIRDHIHIAAAISKPLVVGEFGMRNNKSSTYDSWLTTTLLDEGAGALVWQILEGARNDPEGFGVRCPDDETVCSVLNIQARYFHSKSVTGFVPVPSRFALLQNYPNPFNEQTTIRYDLPFDANAILTVYNTAGQQVATLVDGFQRRGVRKELFGGRGFASGAYFVRLVVEDATTVKRASHTETKRIMLLK